MDEKITISTLLGEYGKLLTEKQREIAELYFACDLSLGEIAEIKSISRQSVLDAIKTVKADLLDYESKLNIVLIKSQLEEVAKTTDEKTSKRITEIIEN